MSYAFLGFDEAGLRLAAFVFVALAMGVLERLAPRRHEPMSRRARWFANFGLVAIDALALRLLLPVAAVGAALWADSVGWGLLNGVPVPAYAAWAVTLLALDLSIYGQHVAFHKVSPLWRMHRVHHCDLKIDVSTGVRFHPAEILLSMLWKMAVVVALGAPPGAVVAFEIVLNATALFNHANLRIPSRADRWLRRFVVTPDMHRVHHSIVRAETDSNFGFNLPWWDRLFGTYRAEPAAGHEGMTLGIERYRQDRDQRLLSLLRQPLDP